MCWKRLNIFGAPTSLSAVREHPCSRSYPLATASGSVLVLPSNQPSPLPHRVAPVCGWLFPSDQFQPATQLTKRSLRPNARRLNLFAESFGPRPPIAALRRFGADDHPRPAETEP